MLRLVTEVYRTHDTKSFLFTFDNLLETNAHKCCLHMINEWFGSVCEICHLKWNRNRVSVTVIAKSKIALSCESTVLIMLCTLVCVFFLFYKDLE